MQNKTNEQALESAIEKALVGFSKEEFLEGVAEQSKYGNKFYLGEPKDFDKEYAIDTKRFWHFLETSQKEELENLKKLGGDYRLKILQQLDKMIKRYSILEVLKKGLKVDNAHFTLFYNAPLASSSQKVQQNFYLNEFSITRQVHYSLKNPRESIDIVIFLNGLPIVTMELKNPWTGQRAKIEGINQYKNRDFTQPLLQFARCIVHFALDTEEVYMTTKLQGAKTIFLPFNKGYNNSSGNPPNPNGYKTSYLWEDILTPLSIADILEHFVNLSKDKKTKLSQRDLYFPRYHQLDVVRKLVSDIEKNGIGKRYLIQHSAGSGKSNSITWSAYRFIEIYDKKLQKPLFDSVMVVTDRRQLDKQIKENIQNFSQIKNIVAHANSSKELKEHLHRGKKIIISTIQKFPYILDAMDELKDKNFAVIIDEAHSSQSGSAHDSMNMVLGDEEVDVQDKIVQMIQKRKLKKNISYFAFTATPKPITLEKFGTKQEDGSYRPFHIYSMKQAIEEGFILDVLTNYTTYKSYYQIQKSIADNPLFDSVEAKKKLKRFVEQNALTIEIKAEIMLDHFLQNVIAKKKLKGKAKGMVVTQNIQMAIRYYFALKKKLEENGNPFKILIAFSGTKKIDGVEYSESDLNGFASNKIAEEFEKDEYRLLVVANKFTTGFDQPKLCAMYVDKKLQGVQAVQTLSRLNRAANELGKRSEDLFILDFYNSVDDIKEAFEPFYTATTLSSATDVNVLHELQDILDSEGVYEIDEVEEFIQKYFDNADGKELSTILDRAAARFNGDLGLSEEAKADFKIKAKQFVKLYAQMASILPYEVVEWEKRYWFLKFLIPKLIVRDKKVDKIDELLESVDLASYGLRRDRLNASIKLEEQGELDPTNANPRGVHSKENPKEELEVIVKEFNERFFSGWDETPQEQKIRFVNLVNSIKSHPDFEEKYLNNPDIHNRELAFVKILDEVMLKNRKKEIEIYKKYIEDEEFKRSYIDMARMFLESVANG